MTEQDIQNIAPEKNEDNSNDSTLENLISMVEKLPGGLDKLSRLLTDKINISNADSSELNRGIKDTPSPSEQTNESAIFQQQYQEQTLHQTKGINLSALDDTEFINTDSGETGDHRQTLKSHLILRYKNMSGEMADSVVEEAYDRMIERYQLTNTLPSNPTKELRANAISILNNAAKKAMEMERQSVTMMAMHLNIAEKEFGANHVHKKKAEADEYISTVLGIPREEVGLMKPERYAKLLQHYSQKTLTPQEAIETNRKSKEYFDDFIDIMRKA